MGIVGLLMWADEAEHGGWEAMDGLAEGYLPGALVEVREVPWASGNDELATSYEVRLVEGDTYEVAFVDRQGQPIANAPVRFFISGIGDALPR